MIPDVPVPIEAWKGFAKRRGSFVSPIFHPDIITYEVGRAQQCTCLILRGADMVEELGPDVLDSLREHHGPLPSEECGCGFWVTRKREQVLGTHVGRVRIWGKVIEYDQGYRAEWIELLEKPKRIRPFNWTFFFPFGRTGPGYTWLCGLVILLSSAYFSQPWYTYLTILGDGCYGVAFGWLFANFIRRKLKERKKSQ